MIQLKKGGNMEQFLSLFVSKAYANPCAIVNGVANCGGGITKEDMITKLFYIGVLSLAVIVGIVVFFIIKKRKK